MLKKDRTKILVIILIAIFLIQTISSMLQKNITGDEFFYLPQGYLYLNTGKTFLVTLPPLIYSIASIPLLFLDLKLPPNYNELYLKNEYSLYATEFLYKANNNSELITQLGRIPIILLSIILALFVFKWAKKLYGEKAALFALFLYVFSPNILAHSRLTTTDLGFSLFFFLSIYFFWKFTYKKNWKNLVLTGLFFGLAQISKTTALVIIPLYILFALIIILYSNKFYQKNIFKKRKKDIKIWIYSLISIFIIGLLIINTTYGFKGSFKSLGKNLEDDESLYFDKSIYNTDSITNKIISKDGILKKVVHFSIDEIPIIIPYTYLKKVVGIIKIGSTEKFIGGYLLGKNYYGGKWYYSFFAFLIKTPIAMLIFILLTLIFYKRIKNKNILNELFIVLPILTILLFFSFYQANAGLRYILPVYPFLFIFVSKIVNIKEISGQSPESLSNLKKFDKKRKIILPVITLLSIWYLLSSLFIYPHYLAYFNEFVGPANGSYFLTDSNIDWGQDLKNLKKYMDANNIEHVKLAYFGNALPDYYGINYEKLAYFADPEREEHCTPTNGTIAISVTFLQDTRYLKNESCFEWLRKYEPIEKIGYSIFVYDIP